MKEYFVESKDNFAYHKFTINHYGKTEIVCVEDEYLEGFEQCLNALGFIKEYPESEEDDMPTETTPCDHGECPFGAEGGYDCRNYCGLGVDKDEEDEWHPDLEAEYEFDHSYEDRYYTPSSTNGDYGPGNPWDAPGMSIHDFI